MSRHPNVYCQTTAKAVGKKPVVSNEGDASWDRFLEQSVCGLRSEEQREDWPGKPCREGHFRRDSIKTHRWGS